jgi:hypothetical protein
MRDADIISGTYDLNIKSTFVIRETEQPTAPATFTNVSFVSLSTPQISEPPSVSFNTWLYQDPSTLFTVRVLLSENSMWIYEKEARVIQLTDAAVILILTLISVYNVLVVITKIEKKVRWWWCKGEKMSESTPLLATNELHEA